MIQHGHILVVAQDIPIIVTNRILHHTQRTGYINGCRYVQVLSCLYHRHAFHLVLQRGQHGRELTRAGVSVDEHLRAVVGVGATP